MVAQVEKQFQKLEKQRNDLMKQLSILTHEQLNYKPSDNSWSILQVLNHLIYAETNTVKYLQKKMQGIDKLKKASMSSMLRSMMLNTFLKSPFKFKAPKAANPLQEDVYLFENLKKQWDEVRQNFREVLEKLDANAADKLLFKHPIAGYFNIKQTLSFITEHIDHHKKQIERIKLSNSSKTPSK